MSEQTGSVVAAPGGPRARDGPPRPVSRSVVLALSTLALGATAGAVYLSAASHHAPNPAGHAALSVVVCLTFVGAGALALRRPPYVRFGFLLVAVGLASLLGSLHDANGATLYTVGVIAANLVFAVLVHALLAFPHGRLGSRSNRLLAVAAYADVLLLQAVAALFDPLTRWHSDHPRNVALVAAHTPLATALEEVEAGIAILLGLAVVTVLYRGTREKTAVARRQLLPVLLGGKIALLAFAIGLVLAPLSSDAAVVGIGIGLLVSLALPLSFLANMLQGRLSRAAVGELLVELREQAETPGLQDALRRALDDPSLELGRLGRDGAYRDESGLPLALPRPHDARVATPVAYQGARVGVLVHDRSLRLRPELLDAVSAAAGFALANERALTRVQRVEERNRALLDAIPDLMFRVARDGTYLDVHAHDPSGLVRPPEQLIGSNVRDVLPPETAEEVLACLRRSLDTGRMSSVEYTLELDGVVRWFESRMVPSGPDETLSIVRDFTDKRRADEELRRLAEEQAALRRVATLVAGDSPPERVFQAVTEEVARLLGIREAVLERFVDARTGTVVGRFGSHMVGGFDIGSTLPIEEGLVAWQVLRTGAPARVDDFKVGSGELAQRIRALGYRSAVGVPIVIAGSTWGVLVAALREGETLPPETERRMQAFAELVALAVASAQAREELEASRLRIVEASDEERRRLERNLHDGAQQRLVALSVGLRLAQSRIRTAPEEAEELLGIAVDELNEALTELRELAQGIHPAILTERGLEAALEVLAARTPVPVELDVRLDERLPEPVEAAAYYVVAEALANVVKHARARAAQVRATQVDGSAVVEVADDGAGGADPEGSGLCGLRDRVEALAGALEVDSARGRGTRVRAELPVRQRVPEVVQG